MAEEGLHPLSGQALHQISLIGPGDQGQDMGLSNWLAKI